MHESNPKATLGYIAQQLDTLGIAYLHVIEPRIKGNETIDKMPSLSRCNTYAPCSRGQSLRREGFIDKVPRHFCPMATQTCLPRDYIVCLQDRAIAPPLQRLMIERAGCDTVHELDAGHCPFLSMPWEVAQLLNRIAQ